MGGGCAGYTMVARATHCFPMQRESPVSSSDGVTTGSKPADAIDRGDKIGLDQTRSAYRDLVVDG